MSLRILWHRGCCITYDYIYNKLPYCGNLLYLCSVKILLTMITVYFEDSDLEEYVQEGRSKVKPYKDYAKDKNFTERLQTVVETMRSVDNASELSCFSFLKYEKLKHSYSGFSSVRIINNRVERLIFKETEKGLKITIIEINDTHYGNKK